MWEERAEGRERGGGPGWQDGHGGGFGGRGGGGRGRDEDSLRGYRDHRLILSGLSFLVDWPLSHFLVFPSSFWALWP